MARENANGTPVVQGELVAARQANDRGVKRGSVTYRPAVVVYDLDDRYELHLDLPGTTAEQIRATVLDRVLTIEATAGERRPQDAVSLHEEYGVGDFRRQIRLGEDIDTERLGAAYTHGVLTLTLPKAAKQQPRRIEITPA